VGRRSRGLRRSERFRVTPSGAARLGGAGPEGGGRAALHHGTARHGTAWHGRRNLSASLELGAPLRALGDVPEGWGGASLSEGRNQRGVLQREPGESWSSFGIQELMLP